MSEEKQELLTAEDMIKPHIYKNVESFGDAITPDKAEDLMHKFSDQQTKALREENEMLKCQVTNDDIGVWIKKYREIFSELAQVKEQLKNAEDVNSNHRDTLIELQLAYGNALAELNEVKEQKSELVNVYCKSCDRVIKLEEHNKQLAEALEREKKLHQSTEDYSRLQGKEIRELKRNLVV